MLKYLTCRFSFAKYDIIIHTVTNGEIDSMADDLLIMGKYNPVFNSILEINIPEKYIIYRSEGLPIHMKKRNHENCLKYVECIPEIIKAPDYIGVNPNEKKTDSVELVKRYEDNVLVGIKLDKSSEYLYVSTMHDIPETKIARRLHSGRLKEFNVDKIGNNQYNHIEK